VYAKALTLASDSADARFVFLFVSPSPALPNPLRYQIPGCRGSELRIARLALFVHHCRGSSNMATGASKDFASSLRHAPRLELCHGAGKPPSCLTPGLQPWLHV